MGLGHLKDPLSSSLSGKLFADNTLVFQYSLITVDN